MNLVKRNSSELAAHYPQGLGFLGIKLGRWAGKATRFLGGLVSRTVRQFVPLFGDDIGDYIDKIVGAWATSLEKLNGLRGASDGEVTPAEEQQLDYWLNYEFSPYVENLIKEIASALSLPTIKSKIVALNAAMNKINAINAHYLVDATNGLSQNAREQRSYVVYQSLDPVVKTIQLGIASLNVAVDVVPVEFSINIYDFSPLFSASIVTVVQSENYRQKMILGTTKNTTIGTLNPIKTPWTVKPVVTVPTTTTAPTTVIDTKKDTTPVFTLPVSTPIKTGVPVATQPTNVATPVETPVVNLPAGSNSSTSESKTADEPKSKTGLYIGLGLLGAAVIAAAMRKKKEPRKTTSKK